MEWRSTALGHTHLADDSPEINSENLLVIVAPLVFVYGIGLFYLLLEQINFPMPELRYLVIVGPFFALLAGRGWEWAWEHFHWRAPLFWAGVAALLPIFANVQYQVVPLPLYQDGEVAREVARWYRSEPKIQVDFPRIMPTPPGVPYEMDLSMTDKARAVPACRQTVLNPPEGALLVWDPIFGQANSSWEMCTTQEMIESSGWIHYRHFEAYGAYCEVYLSPRTANGEETRSKYKGDWEETMERFRLRGSERRACASVATKN